MKDNRIDIVVITYLNYHHKDVWFHTFIHFAPVVQMRPKKQPAEKKWAPYEGFCNIPAMLCCACGIFFLSQEFRHSISSFYSSCPETTTTGSLIIKKHSHPHVNITCESTCEQEATYARQHINAPFPRRCCRPSVTRWNCWSRRVTSITSALFRFINPSHYTEFLSNPVHID